MAHGMRVAIGVLSVAVLFIIARGLEEAGTLEIVLRGILGESRSLFVSQVHQCHSLTAVSHFFMARMYV